MSRLTITCCLLFQFIVSYSQLPQKSPSANFTQSLNQQGFIRNAGQFTDERNKTVSNILYGTDIGNCGIYITSKGLSYINYKLVGKELKAVSGKSRQGDTVNEYRYDIERVDVTMAHARIQNTNVEEVAETAGDVSYNYYTTSHSKGTTGIRLCKEVIFSNVYPGIDWCVQFVKNGEGKAKLKYNFIVRPGGNIRDIELHYSKNARLKLNESGDITAQTTLSIFTEKAPVSFYKESKDPISLKYKLKGQVLKFEGAAKTFDREVIIDPEVYWATYLPSSQPGNLYQTMLGADVATDNNANIFVTISAATKIPFLTVDPGNGAYYQDYAATGQGAMILLKFNADGKLVWSTYFSGKAQTKGNLLTTDKNGNVFAMGKITSVFHIGDTATDFIPLKNSGGYYDSEPKENFIVEFDDNGKLKWSTFFGGANGTYPEDITTDSLGNLYITGWSTPEDFPIVNPGNGAYMEAGKVPAQLIFISQFGANNKLLWSTHIDGNDYDPDSRVAVDRKGNIYIGSNIRSSVYPLHDAGGYFSSDLWGFAITRFNKDRQITWCTGVPGNPFRFNDLTVDDSCNLYVINGLGTLRKFNEKTELVWTQQHIQTKGYYYERIVYDKSHQVVHILGQMNSLPDDFPTKNTTCKGSFFFDGQAPKYLSATSPIFMTYTTNGDLQYCSVADWWGQYYDYSNFTVDPKGDLIYLFEDIRIPLPEDLLTDPGNGAYFHPEMNNNSQTPFLMKLITSELTIDSTVSLSATCDSNNIIKLMVLCGTAPFSYAWSNGSDSPAVRVPAGDYSVTVTDADFLTKTIRFRIPKAPGSVTDFKVDILNTHCDKKDGSLVVKDIAGGTAPYDFSLDAAPYSSNPAFDNIDSGQHVIMVKDANGCFAKDSFLVKNIPGPSAIHALVTAASCNKNDGVINVDGVTGGFAPFQYSKNNDPYITDSVFSGLPASAVAVSVRDAFGCSFSDSISIAQSLPPDSADIITLPDHCHSSVGSMNIDTIYGGTGPFNISLDNNAYTNQTIINTLANGSYTVYIKDSKNCLLRRQVSIDNIAAPDSIYCKILDATCGATTGKLQIDSIRNGNSPYTFSLNMQNYQAGTLFVDIPEGPHSLTVKDNFGCKSSQPFDIKYVKQYSVKIVPHDTSVCYGQQVSLQLQFENASEVKTIQWNTGELTSSIMILPMQSSPVTVMITDNNDCIIKDTSYVAVTACNSYDKCIGIPTAFTPNGDGINDAMGPLAKGCEIKDLLFQVYNRFGQKMFETTDLNKKWNGKIKGVDQPVGAYVYTCSFISNGNEKSSVKGTFLLLR